MKTYRITFISGFSIDYEADFIKDNGISLEMFDSDGNRCVKYMDSEILSCELVEDVSAVDGYDDGQTLVAVDEDAKPISIVRKGTLDRKNEYGI